MEGKESKEAKRMRIGIIGTRGSAEAIGGMLQHPVDAICACAPDWRLIKPAFEACMSFGAEKIVVDDGVIGTSNEAMEALREAANEAPRKVVFVTSRPVDDNLLYQLASESGADIFHPGMQVDAAKVLTRYVVQGADPTEASPWVICDAKDPRLNTRRKTMGKLKLRRLPAPAPLEVIERSFGSYAGQKELPEAWEPEEAVEMAEAAGADPHTSLPELEDDEAGMEALLTEAEPEDAEWLASLAAEMDPEGAARAAAAAAAAEAGDEPGAAAEEAPAAEPEAETAAETEPAEEGLGDEYSFDESFLEKAAATYTAETAESEDAFEAEAAEPAEDVAEDAVEEEPAQRTETAAEEAAEEGEQEMAKEKAGTQKEAAKAAPVNVEWAEPLDSGVQAAEAAEVEAGEAPEAVADADEGELADIIPIADLLGRPKRVIAEPEPPQTKVTAIMAGRSGVGCSYLACTLASELAATGQRTCLVIGDSETYMEMARACQEGPGSNAYCFGFNGCDVYNWRNRKVMKMGAYDQVVYDLGMVNLGSTSSDSPACVFKQADLPVFVISASPWDLHIVNDYLNAYDPAVLKHWSWAVWGAGKRSKENILRGLATKEALGKGFNKVYTVPSRPDFFSTDFKPQLDMYRALLAPVLPKADAKPEGKEQGKTAAESAEGAQD